MKLILCAVLCFVWAGPAAAELNRDQLSSEVSRQISDTQLELIDWMMFYYRNPRPDEFPGWLRKVSAEGMLKGEERQFPFLGFAATLFAAQEEKVPGWMETIDALPEDERKTVLLALWLSGTRTAKTILASEPRRKLIHGRNYFNFDTNKRPPSLNNLERDSGFLDIQWGRFCASGDEKPVRNIIAVLDINQFISARGKSREARKEREQEIRERKNIARAALWSLRGNCKIYPEVLAICEKVSEEENLNQTVYFAIKSILGELKQEGYNMNEGASQPDSAQTTSRRAAE